MLPRTDPGERYRPGRAFEGADRQCAGHPGADRAVRPAAARRSDDPRLVYLTTSVATAPRAFWGAYAASKAAAEVLVDCYAQEVRNIARSASRSSIPARPARRCGPRPIRAKTRPRVKPPEAVAARLVALLGEQFASPHRERVNQPRKALRNRASAHMSAKPAGKARRQGCHTRGTDHGR